MQTLKHTLVLSVLLLGIQSQGAQSSLPTIEVRKIASQSSTGLDVLQLREAPGDQNQAFARSYSLERIPIAAAADVRSATATTNAHLRGWAVQINLDTRGRRALSIATAKASPKSPIELGIAFGGELRHVIRVQTEMTDGEVWLCDLESREAADAVCDAVLKAPKTN